MRELIPELLTSLGMALLIGGVLTFIYGLQATPGRGGGSGMRPDVTICVLGTVVSAIGAGVGTFGISLLRGRKK